MKTGRNDPCPCGSGRKWKKCCGQLPEPAAPATPAPAEPTPAASATDDEGEPGEGRPHAVTWLPVQRHPKSPRPSRYSRKKPR